MREVQVDGERIARVGVGCGGGGDGELDVVETSEVGWGLGRSRWGERAGWARRRASGRWARARSW